MKLGKYNLTLKNVKAYIQGNVRLIQDKYGEGFMDLSTHVKEQVIMREALAKPACVIKKECDCGCAIPDLFYADKTCEDACYPVLLNRDEWNKFKLYIKENDIELKYGVNIKKIMTEFKNGNRFVDDELRGAKVFTIKNPIRDMGNIVYGETARHRIQIHNPFKDVLKIEEVTTSCPCGSAEWSDGIRPDEMGWVDVIVDSNKKSEGEFELIVDVKFNHVKMKPISLIVKGKVISNDV